MTDEAITKHRLGAPLQLLAWVLMLMLWLSPGMGLASSPVVAL